MIKLIVVVLVESVFVLSLSLSVVFSQDICEGNFDYDQDCDGTDAAAFKQDFGRLIFDNPCPPDGPSPVPTTGQTASYAIGDDGDWVRGVVWPTPRFTDNGDGTITDSLTGLIWLKNANCFGTRTWNNAISDCNGLGNGSCGLTDGSNTGDWRLPNKRELLSLVHDGYYDPSLPNTAGTGQWTEGDPFINVQSLYYWTSTTFPSSADMAWHVRMYFGSLAGDDKSLNDPYVWPVRGGRCGKITVSGNITCDAYTSGLIYGGINEVGTNADLCEFTLDSLGNYECSISPENLNKEAYSFAQWEHDNYSIPGCYASTGDYWGKYGELDDTFHLQCTNRDYDMDLNNEITKLLGGEVTCDEFDSSGVLCIYVWDCPYDPNDLCLVGPSGCYPPHTPGPFNTFVSNIDPNDPDPENRKVWIIGHWSKNGICGPPQSGDYIGEYPGPIDIGNPPSEIFLDACQIQVQ